MEIEAFICAGDNVNSGISSAVPRAHFLEAVNES